MAKNISRKNYAVHIGTPKDTRMVVKYFGREIGRAENLADINAIITKHSEKIKGKKS